MTAPVHPHRRDSDRLAQRGECSIGSRPHEQGRTWIGWRHSLALALDFPLLPTCGVCGCLLADAEHSPRCSA